MRICFYFTIVFLLLAASPGRAGSNVSSSLDAILNGPGMQGSMSGAEVVRVSDGQILYARNADLRLMPASNRKLFTAAAALELLGPQFRLVTTVAADSHPDGSGVLHGDLCLRGGGDGLLSLEDINDLARRTALTGVKRVAGGVCGDGSFFQDGPYGDGWEWDDLSDDYAPQIAGLELNEGLVEVDVTAGRTAGDAVTVSEMPGLGDLPVVNEARTGGPGTPGSVQIFRPYDQNIVIVHGNLAPGTTKKASVPVVDPARFAALAFRAALVRCGIAVDGPAYSGPMPQASDILAAHESLPLAQYLAKMDKPSDNLLAESLVRIVGAERRAAGTYDAGLAASLPFFQRLGVDTATVTLADGSGVSRRNLVTARSLVAVLVGMSRQPNWRDFYDSLPIAGVDGTLRLSMRGTKAAGNLRAKTGTLTGARALSGYVTGRDGSLYAFSLLLNNYVDGPAALRTRDSFAEWLADNL